MPKQKSKTVSVVVADEDEVLYVAELVQRPRSDKCDVTSVVSPEVNLKVLSELFTLLGSSEETNYYMSRVKKLSADARKQIKRALGVDDVEEPFPF